MPLATRPFPELPLREKKVGSNTAFLFEKNQCQICTAALKFEFPRKDTPCECPVTERGALRSRSVNSPGMAISPYLGARLV